MIWQKPDLTYAVEGELDGVGLLRDEMIEPAAVRWSQAGVVSVRPGSDPDLVFCCLPLEPDTRLALGDCPRPDGSPIRCVFNSRRLWCLSTDEPGILLPAIVAHETGHLLGLPHSPVDAISVMSRYWTRRSPRTATAADLAALRRLYLASCRNDQQGLWPS